MEKDVNWKSFFEDNHRYADIINGIGCNGNQLIKSTDLQEVDTSARGKHRDLLRKVALGVNFAIVGIENQETVDYQLPLRAMDYDLTAYQKQSKVFRKENKTHSKNLEPGEYLYGFKKDNKLKPCITFILYAGKTVWNGPTRLFDMLDFTDIPKDLQNMISDYKINVVNIREFENTDVFHTDVKQVFDFIRYSEDKNKLLELLESDIYYSQMEDDAFDVVSKYTNSKELVHINNQPSEGGKRNVCKAIRDLMEDSRAEGLTEGIKQATTDNAINFFKNGASYELVKASIKELSEEELKAIYEEVISC